METETDTLVDALWDLLPSGNVNSEDEFRSEMLESNHDIDIENVNFSDDNEET